MNLAAALETLIAGQDLEPEVMSNVMRTIMAGKATPAQIAGFLVALRCKGETVDEIAAAVDVMRELASTISVHGPHLVDTCGTGGDGTNTFNISTAAALVVAAAGGKVAKHGNRSVSSNCGSADVLEAAGVNLDLSPEQVRECIENIGIGFLFAPRYHGAMKHAVTPRRELGVRTLFNLLGPLSNPAGAPNQVVGVFDKSWVEPLAQVLLKLGSHHVLVVHAEDGLDEISIGAPTFVAELKNEQVANYTVTPGQFGFERADISTLAVLDVQHGLSMLREVAANNPGPALDIVLLNAGAAIYAANLTVTLEEGIEKARRVTENGLVRNKLNDLVRYSQSFQSPPGMTPTGTAAATYTSVKPGEPADILKEIIQTKIEEIERRKKRMSVSDLQEQIKEAPLARGFYQQLKTKIDGGEPGVIAEIKKASPSKGVLREKFHPIELAQDYAKGGAACLSVLTDRKFFQGSEVYLQLIHDAVSLPVLRKDFLIDPYQIFESRAIEADCILLIVAALVDSQMKELTDTAIELGMDVLVEVHDRAELDRALALDLSLIGINNRNLKTFETSIQTTLDLLEHVPPDRLIVSESGIHCKDDIELLQQNNVNAFLVGEAFMKSEAPGQMLQELFF